MYSCIHVYTNRFMLYFHLVWWTESVLFHRIFSLDEWKVRIYLQEILRWMLKDIKCKIKLMIASHTLIQAVWGLDLKWWIKKIDLFYFFDLVIIFQFFNVLSDSVNLGGANHSLQPFIILQIEINNEQKVAPPIHFAVGLNVLQSLVTFLMIYSYSSGAVTHLGWCAL